MVSNRNDDEAPHNEYGSESSKSETIIVKTHQL